MVVLAGCATSIPGTPVPVAGDPAAVVDLPPRPRVVPVDGIDPCTLLTEADRAELRLDFEPRLTVSPSGLYNGGVIQLCSIRSSVPGVGSVGVALSVTGGIELFLRPRVPAVITPTSAAGFPAVIADPNRFTEFCNVVVDVAPRQVVDIDVANAGNVPPIPEAELCREAGRVAEIVMRNLLNRA